MKRIIAVLLAFTLLLCAVPAVAFADGDQSLTYEQYRMMKTAASTMEDYILHNSANLIIPVVESMEKTHPQYVYYNGYDGKYNLGYCLAPLDVFEAEFRIANPKMPKNLFHDYIFSHEPFVGDVECYDYNHNPTVITIGYDEATGNYGAVNAGGVGGDKMYDFDGYVDNGDGTYNFYLAKGDFDWDTETFTKTSGGIVFRFRPDDDGVYMFGYEEVAELPSVYSPAPEYTVVIPTHEEYMNMLKTVDFVCGIYFTDYISGDGIDAYFYTSYIYEKGIEMFPEKYTPGSENEAFHYGTLRLTEDEITAVACAEYPYIAESSLRSLLVSKILRTNSENGVYSIYDAPGIGGFGYIKNTDLGNYLGYKANDDGTYSFYHSVPEHISYETTLTKEEREEFWELLQTNGYPNELEYKGILWHYDDEDFCTYGEDEIRVFNFRLVDGKAEYISDVWGAALPDAFDEVPVAQLSYKQFKRVKATADFLFDYFFGLGEECKMSGVAYYLKNNFPDRVQTYHSGWTNDNEELIISDWEPYIVMPAELANEYYYAAEPAAPKGFYLSYVLYSFISEYEEYDPEIPGYRQFKPVTAYTADGEPVEIHLGYDSEAGTYGWAQPAIGGPTGYKYAGFIDNANDTYTFYYSRIDYDWKAASDHPTGVYLTVGLEGDDTLYIGYGYMNTALPEEYTKEPLMKGDPDGDGEITVADALIALRVAAKLEVQTDELLAVCDVDGSGNIDVGDALVILRVAVKLVPPLD